ncbi:MAG: SPFH domain-containing protein [Dactylosporangium sp.]|nr:SPFH domain-containing protein [Dactylosporangium sp.]NNJ60333.1 SPFH domain-containing protein [Dactylosporangium sp.]
MADISRFTFLRHFRGTPTGYVVHTQRGRRIHEGTGLSFWFRPLSAVLSEVPVDDRELPMLFHARTADFQDVTVQATLTFRFTDPALAAQRLDFALDPTRGTWRGGPLEQVAHLLTELAQQHALDLLTSTPVAEVLSGGVQLVRDRIAGGLADDPRLQETAITVLGVRVVAIRPDPDLERALQTPIREQVQQEADRATYERRARAVERERAISENELQSKIELAVREERLVTQRGANARRKATETAAADHITAESTAETKRLIAAAEADALRLHGTAAADAEAARMAAYADLDPQVLLALALRELAGQLPEIGSLTVTPDLVSSALARFAAREG